jgi:hypothetical protein
MSLGANFSSGLTNKLTDDAIKAGIPKSQSIAYSNKCCDLPMQQTRTNYPSMVISKPCPRPTPAEFALYPKVAVPSSIRTQAIMDGCRNQTSRFSQYERYRIPVPCLPLPASANMAGISLPSSRECNL